MAMVTVAGVGMGIGYLSLLGLYLALMLRRCALPGNIAVETI
jgi:hypothetical protein